MDKSILRKALADNADPTPGYLYRDIAQMTFVDQQTQQKLLGYLFDKLSPSTSVHVLAKTMRVIKNLCETGHADFQREVQRLNDRMKEFASFRGKMDPKFGDSLNEKVRQAAKDAIDAAFSPRKDTQKMQVNSVGMGSSAGPDAPKETFKTGVSVTTGQSGPMAPTTGGSSHCAPMPTTNKWADHMAKHGQAPGQQGVLGGFKADVQRATSTGFGLWHEGLKSDQQRIISGLSSDPGEFKPAEIPTAGFGGGGPAAAEPASSGWGFTEEQNNGTAGGASTAPTPVEVTMLTPMEKEVEKMSLSKSAPMRVDLTNFLATVTALAEQGGDHKWDELAQALDAKLTQKNTWQVRLNILCVTEHIVRNGGDAVQPLRDYFVENPEDIQRNQHVVQASLKDKATKVMRALNIPEKNANQQQSGAQSANVMTSAAGTAWGPTANTGAEAPPTTAGNGVDFGGMTVKATTRRGKGGAGSTGPDGGFTATGGMVGSAGAATAPEEKTKLRKRAQQLAPASAPADDSWGQGGGAGGWGDAGATTTTSGDAWGNGGGWGDATPTAQPEATATPPTMATPVQQQPTGIDALFAGGAAPPPAMTGQPVMAAGGAPPTPTAAGVDSLFSALPTAPAPAPAPAPMAMPAQQMQMPMAQNGMGQPQMMGQPAPAPAPMAGHGDVDLDLVRRQMAQMQVEMSQAMAAMGQGDATAQVRVQSLMMQQQQLMQQLATANARPQMAAPMAGAPAGAGAPMMAGQQQPMGQPQPPQQNAAANAQFAMLGAEMKSTFGY